MLESKIAEILGVSAEFVQQAYPQFVEKQIVESTFLGYVCIGISIVLLIACIVTVVYLCSVYEEYGLAGLSAFLFIVLIIVIGVLLGGSAMMNAHLWTCNPDGMMLEQVLKGIGG